MVVERVAKRRANTPWPACGLLTLLTLAGCTTPQAERVEPATSVAPPTATTAPAGVSLRYEITLRRPAEKMVDVTLSIEGLAGRRGELRFTMNREFAYVRLPEPLLAGPPLALAGDIELTVASPAPYDWRVELGGGGDLRLHYSVPLTHREIAAVRERDEYEYPFVSEDCAMLPTGAIIIYPEGLRATALQVKLNAPDGWRVHAPWPATAADEYEPPSRSALHDDLIALGRWSPTDVRVGDFVGTLVFMPDQLSLKLAVTTPIRRIIEHELALFGRPAQGRYLFVFGPPIEHGLAGSPKSHSMTLAVDPAIVEAGGLDVICHLIAHEFFHTWAVAEAHVPDELRWINEGFTDYYAYLVCARLKLISWQQFADKLAEKMEKTIHNGHYEKMSLAAAGGPVFFTDRSAYDLVYDGGLVVAAWLDRAIRSAGQGKTLDDFMRELINDPRWDPAAERGPALEDVFALIRRYVPGTTADDIIAAVSKPYRLNPVAAFGPVGVEIERVDGRPDLDLRANLDGTRIVDMDPRDFAHTVGLRPGDELIEINGHAVTSASGVYAAWSSPRGQRVTVKLVRDGETVEIDQAMPTTSAFKVPVGPWLAHRQ